MPDRAPAEPNETDSDGRFRSVRPVDHEIADVLDARDRVIERAEALALGLTERELYGRVRRGTMHRAHRGVYTAGGRVLDERGAWRAAVAAVGADAFLDGASACALWGFREAADRETIHVVCRREVRAPEGVTVHWQRDLTDAETALCRGVRVVMPARALLGYAAQERSPDRLRRVVNQALVDRRVSSPQLIELLTRSRGRRGAGRLARVLAGAMPTRSELEDIAVAALRGYGAIGFGTNVTVAGCEVDIFFAEAGLVVECDGRQFHDTPLARAADAAKTARLEAAGLHVERVRMRDLTVDLHRRIPRLLAVVHERTERNRR